MHVKCYNQRLKTQLTQWKDFKQQPLIAPFTPPQTNNNYNKKGYNLHAKKVKARLQSKQSECFNLLLDPVVK